MKTLLIRPPATYAKNSLNPSVGMPIGLLYIAAVLEQHGFAVEILDCQVNSDKPLLKNMDGSMQMGLSWEEISRRIKLANADIVGVSAPFSAQLHNALQTAELVRSLAPSALIVMGGNHPTVRFEDCFSMTGSIDLACIGEGELTMLEIVRAHIAGEDTSLIAGTASRSGKNPVRARIVELDVLPLPAYHLIDMEAYFNLYSQGYTERIARRYPGSERAVSVITSRGCPFNCVFCSIHLHMGRRWRSHSVEYVRRHLDLLELHYGVRHIHFEDDNLSADPRRFREILLLLRDRSTLFTWDTPNGIRVDSLNRELIELCKASGCVYLVFGVESGNRRVLHEVVDKNLDLDSVITAAGWCRDIGLDTMAFYVIGFPGERLDEMRDTTRFALDLMKQFDVLPNLFVATPLPGTRLESVCIEKGYLEQPLRPQDYAAMTQGGCFIETDTFSRDEIAAVLSGFSRQVKQVFIRNSLKFVMLHPTVLPRLIKEIIWLSKSISITKAAYRVLEFKNCLR